MIPGPPTEFQWRNVKVFTFSVHRLLMRWVKLLIPLMCVYHSLPFSPSSFKVYRFIPKTKV